MREAVWCSTMQRRTSTEIFDWWKESGKHRDEAARIDTRLQVPKIAIWLSGYQSGRSNTVLDAASANRNLTGAANT
jgi:hypothetical protein